MKRIFTGILFAAALTAPALAADLASHYKAPAIAPAANWTGFYIGGQIGGASISTKFEDVDDAFDSQGLNPDRKNSFTGGVYGGYNWQISSFVLGVDAQWSWYDLKVTSYPWSFAPAADVFITTKVRDAGSVKARMGLAFTDTLVYVAAGPAWASSKLSGAFFDELFSNNKVVSGWAAAIGVEHMITPNWIVRGQVQYAGYNTQHAVGNFGDTFGQTSDVVEATVGVSYKFNPLW